MAKKMTLEEMRNRDKQLMQQHKEMQEMIRKAEAAEREHIAADIVQACMEMASSMPEDARPELKDIPDLIRKMWSAYSPEVKDLTAAKADHISQKEKDD